MKNRGTKCLHEHRSSMAVRSYNLKNSGELLIMLYKIFDNWFKLQSKHNLRKTKIYGIKLKHEFLVYMGVGTQNFKNSEKLETLFCQTFSQ